MSPAAKAEVRVGPRVVQVSRPEKELFPDDGITKADLARYYEPSLGGCCRICANAR